jgi:hypothetical protein
MRRLTTAVTLGALLGVLAGVLTASPAFAGRGPKWQVEPAVPFTVPAGVCGFRIGVTFPVAKEYEKVLKAADGSTTILSTGSLKVSYTNLRTGKAITENVSGPGKVTTHADGSVTVAFRGHTGSFLSPGGAKQFGLPAVSVTTGKFTESIAPDGTITSITVRGHVLVDVCAALS